MLKHTFLNLKIEVLFKKLYGLNKDRILYSSISRKNHNEHILCKIRKKLVYEMERTNEKLSLEIFTKSVFICKEVVIICLCD